jgi:hypothetical protein
MHNHVHTKRNSMTGQILCNYTVFENNPGSIPARYSYIQSTHCPKREELKFKLLNYFLIQLNIKLYGTFPPLFLSIQLNFKPYLRMRLWNILYNIFQRRILK